MNKNVVTREVYQLIESNWKTWREQVLNLLQPDFSKPYKIRDRQAVLEDLVKKLMRDIPPNEIGIWPKTAPASLQDILNAGWAFKIKQVVTNPGWSTLSNHEKMFRLLLKAIESSHLHSFYIKQTARPDEK